MLKWLVLLLSLVLAVIAFRFAMANQGEVIVNLPFNAITQIRHLRIPLFGLVFAPMFAGLFLGVLLSEMGKSGFRRELLRLRQQNQELEEELINLRNLPLEHDIH